MRTPDDQRGGTIRQFILANLDDHPHDITTLTARRFDMTRQAVNLHMMRLIKEAQITRKGQTRKTRFYLKPKKTWQKQYARQQSESDVWENDVLPQLSDLPENALDVWRYCFTEMFNNAVDHSSGTRITVQLKRTAVNAEIAVIDNGVGIFKKIQRAMKFSDERYSALKLAKGKFTTDPHLLADLFAYNFSGHDNLDTPILLSSVSGTVVCDWRGLSKTLGGDVRTGQPFVNEILPYGFRTLLRKRLIEFFAADIISMAFHGEIQPWVRQNNAC